MLDLKIPPVAVALCAAALMWIAARFVPAGDIPFPARLLVSTTCAAAGVVTSGLGVLAFRRARTTVNPMRPGTAAVLVRSGVYSLTRNPMYLGFLLMLCGWTILLCNALAFPILPMFIRYMNRFQIEPEELALSRIFGAEFTAYTERVGRWIRPQRFTG